MIDVPKNQLFVPSVFGFDDRMAEAVGAVWVSEDFDHADVVLVQVVLDEILLHSHWKNNHDAFQEFLTE